MEAKDPMLQFFQWGHLPYPLQQVSRPFCELAERIVDTLPRNPERTVALRKLLESKDCAVRAQIYDIGRPVDSKEPPIPPPSSAT